MEINFTIWHGYGRVILRSIGVPVRALFHTSFESCADHACHLRKFLGTEGAGARHACQFANLRALQPSSVCCCQEIVCSRYKTLELLRPTEKNAAVSRPLAQQRIIAALGPTIPEKCKASCPWSVAECRVVQADSSCKKWPNC